MLEFDELGLGLKHFEVEVCDYVYVDGCEWIRVYMSSPKSSAAMEGSNDGGAVSKMLSGFQSSENRAVESAVPQVALQAFAFLSENTAAQVYRFPSFPRFKLSLLLFGICLRLLRI